MKTVLVYVYDSNIVRNILRTQVLPTLTNSPEIGKVVLLVHAFRVEAYREEFTHPKIVLETYPPNLPSKAELVAWFLIRQTIPTNNVRIKIDELLDRTPNLKIPKYLFALSFHTLSKVSFLRKIIRFFLRIPFSTNTFKPLVEKYNPDLVFLPTTYDINDIRLLKYCKAHSIRTVGMVKSWDNLLGKDALIVRPDFLIVHSETLKRQAITLTGYPEKDIFISGIPQFDVYADKTFISSKEAFLVEMGLDSHKKIILYACMGGWINLHEREMIETLADIIANGKLQEPAQLLVRLHPAYLSDDEELKKIPGIILDRPGNGNFDRNAWRADFEFSVKDTRRLANTLKWSDVVIHSGSTISIDAAAFDLPIINPGYDAKTSNEKYERSARRLLKKDHYKQIVNTGGVTVVEDDQQLISALDRYLQNRTLEHQGRTRIITEHVYKLDGKAGERIGNFIIDSLPTQ